MRQGPCARLHRRGSESARWRPCPASVTRGLFHEAIQDNIGVNQQTHVPSTQVLLVDARQPGIPGILAFPRAPSPLANEPRRFLQGFFAKSAGGGNLETNRVAFNVELHPVISAGKTEGIESCRFGNLLHGERLSLHALRVKPTCIPQRYQTSPSPAASADAVTESGKPLAKADGVKFVKMENGRAVCGLQSGSYRFETGQ
jgi:hypothetical protein